MAHDPAKARVITAIAIRLEAQECCRYVPCSKVQDLLAGSRQVKVLPCIVCVHEGKVRQALIENRQ